MGIRSGEAIQAYGLQPEPAPLLSKSKRVMLGGESTLKLRDTYLGIVVLLCSLTLGSLSMPQARAANDSDPFGEPYEYASCRHGHALDDLTLGTCVAFAAANGQTGKLNSRTYWESPGDGLLPGRGSPIAESGFVKVVSLEKPVNRIEVLVKLEIEQALVTKTWHSPEELGSYGAATLAVTLQGSNLCPNGCTRYGVGQTLASVGQPEVRDTRLSVQLIVEDQHGSYIGPVEFGVGTFVNAWLNVNGIDTGSATSLASVRILELEVRHGSRGRIDRGGQ